MKILTVDDEPDVIKVITMSFNLQQPDWQILSARDGETALELVDRERPGAGEGDAHVPLVLGVARARLRQVDRVATRSAMRMKYVSLSGRGIIPGSRERP